MMSAVSADSALSTPYSKVMVWSAGATGKVEIGLANGGTNEDNVIGWK